MEKELYMGDPGPEKEIPYALFESRASMGQMIAQTGIQSGAHSYLYHWHDAVEILYGLEKSTTVGIMGNSYVLGQGEIVVIGAGRNHCLFPSDYSSRRLTVMFEPVSLFSGVFAPYRNCYSQIKCHSTDWPPETREKVTACVLAIHEENIQRQEGWQQALLAKLLEMTVTVIRELPQTQSEDAPQDDNVLRKILAYLSDHYLNDISLQSCADALGFNSSYLSSLFRKQTGATFHQYLLNLRMNKAEWLLENTDLPVARVAEDAGFSSTKTFHRVFLTTYGVPPGVYRKNLGKGG